MMWKLSLKYALICGTFLVLIFWLSFRFGSNPLIDFRHLFFDLILFALFIFFSNKEFKTYRNGGILHFWQGMTLGFFTYLPATVIFLVGVSLFFYFDPELLAGFKVEAIEFMERNKTEFLMDLSEQEYASRVKRVEEVTDGQMVASAALKKFLAGMFVSPVIAIILRKKPI